MRRVLSLGVCMSLALLCAIWVGQHPETSAPPAAAPPQATSPATPPASSAPGVALPQLPMQFEENRGQAASDVRYLARGPGYGLLLSRDQAVLRMATPAPAEDRASRGTATLRMRLLGASQAPKTVGEAPLEGKVNYLGGDDPADWHTDIPTFARVRQAEVYPGIDLVYHGNGSQLEYDFVVGAGADPGQVRLSLEGADSVKLDSHGDLALGIGGGTLVQHKPVVFQKIGGKRVPVPGRYRLSEPARAGDHVQVTFKIGSYDEAHPLVIDPTLSYSTFLGGSLADSVNAIAVGNDGSTYLTGDTNSPDFDMVNPIEDRSSAYDGFVTKLNASGNAIAYSTYLGHHSQDSLYGIGVDGAGNAYVAGYEINGAVQEGGMGRDVRVYRLNAAGNAVDYKRVMHWGRYDYAYAIAVDAPGNAYVTGMADGNTGQVFVIKLDPSGNTVYSMFPGGGGGDFGSAIAVDGSGNAYVAGGTTSSDFPTVNAIEGPNGGQDGFVLKVNPTGTALVYSTYLGGSGIDVPHAIAVDAAGEAVVAGETQSTDFNRVGGIEGDAPGTDGFVAKLAAGGSSLIYSTYLGGATTDVALAIDLDSASNAYVAGYTDSTDFNLVDPYEGRSGLEDAFVAKLNPAGSALEYSTYLGGQTSDRAKAIAVDGAGIAHVGGSTFSSNFDTVNPLEGDSGGLDAFVAKLGGDITPDAFDFPDVANWPANKGVLSAPVTISGLPGPTFVSIAGDSSARYRVNGAPLTAANGLIDNGDVLQLRLVSSPNLGQNVLTIVTVGDFSANWSVRTEAGDATPNAFSFVDLSGRPPSTGTVSNLVTIAGLSGRVPISISGDGSARYRVNGGPLTAAAGWIGNGDTLELRLLSPATSGDVAHAHVIVGTFATSWQVTTGSGPDTTPDPFDFIDVQDQPVNTTTVSNSVTISGLGGPVNVTLAGHATARFRINGGPLTRTGTVVNGDTVRLQLVSAPTEWTTRSAVLTVGTFTANWQVRTPPDLTPDPFDFGNVSGRPPNLVTVSNAVTVSGLSKGVTVSISGDSSRRYRVNGGPMIANPQLVHNGDIVELRLISSATPGATVSMTVSIGTRSDSWFLTTRP